MTPWLEPAFGLQTGTAVAFGLAPFFEAGLEVAPFRTIELPLLLMVSAEVVIRGW